MTRPRTLARALAPVAVVGGILALYATADATEPAPAAPVTVRCIPDPLVPGARFCAIPTSGRPAVIHVTAWEDGSARVVAIDPDAPIPADLP